MRVREVVTGEPSNGHFVQTVKKEIRLENRIRTRHLHLLLVLCNFASLNAKSGIWGHQGIKKATAEKHFERQNDPEHSAQRRNNWSGWCVTSS